MTETLTGLQVLSLLAQDEPPEIECKSGALWTDFNQIVWSIPTLRGTTVKFRIKPTPARRLSVTLANGEVVSWPEPVRGALEYDTMYYIVKGGEVVQCEWDNHRLDKARLAAGVIHLTREAAQEHADALRKINTQEVV